MKGFRLSKMFISSLVASTLVISNLSNMHLISQVMAAETAPTTDQDQNNKDCDVQNNDLKKTNQTDDEGEEEETDHTLDPEEEEPQVGKTNSSLR